MNLIKILKNSQTLSVIPIEDFPGTGGTGGGGTGTNPGGTTSSNLVSSLTLSPSTDQSIVTGTTLCLTASGIVSFPQEVEQTARLSAGCSPTTNGTYRKNSGTNFLHDCETFDPRPIYQNQPFQITGTNNNFSTPGAPFLNSNLTLGARTSNGYSFWWQVYRYCNNSISGCSNAWYGSIRMYSPNGSSTTFVTGLVGYNQQFRLRSDGNTISWDYTTNGNFVNNRWYMRMPENAGNFYFMVNALFLGNIWNNLKTSKGSYQATPRPEDYIWTSDCTDSLVVTGDKACYTPITPGYCRICVSTIDLDPKCVSVVSSPLTLTPVGVPCGSCGLSTTDCLNIPKPTIPVVTLQSLSPTSINVNWNDSISFTSGLYYEIAVNNSIERALGSTVILTGLSAATYNISVRAIDNCGASIWSAVNTITLGSIAFANLDRPNNFTILLENESQLNESSLNSYRLQWDAVPSDNIVEYEVWVGDPQSDKIITTSSIDIVIDSLSTGTSLSVRAKDDLDNYSLFSEIQVTFN